MKGGPGEGGKGRKRKKSKGWTNGGGVRDAG